MAARKHPSVVGQTFGDMRVVKEHTTGQLRSYYEGICICGRPVFSKKEYIHDKLTKRGHYHYSCRHNHLSKPHVKLGATRKDSELHPTYKSWESMRYRCLNSNSPDYPGYGGRGITICRPWDSFENFLHDMGMRPEGTSLGRINNDGNYEPSNCRWETPKQQQNNTSYNVNVGGYSISELAAKTGLTYNAVELRLRRGHTVEEILETPRNHPAKKYLRPTVGDIGMRNGKLVVKEVRKTDKEVIYLCECDCGNLKEVTRRNFKKTQSCGCLKSESAKTKKAVKPSSISQEYNSFPVISSASIGKKYSKLTVLEVRRKTLKPGVYKQYAKCRCDCGNETIVAMGNLTGNPQHTTSCGCAKEGSQGPSVSTIPIGARFGKLLVCSIKLQHGTHTMHCRCDCGTSVAVAALFLKNGSVTSCGCESLPAMGTITLIEPTIPKVKPKLEINIEVVPSRFLNPEIEVVPTRYAGEDKKIVNPSPVLTPTRIETDGYVYREIEYLGEVRTIREWAAKLDLNLSTILSRLSRGYTDPEKLFSPEKFKPGSKPGSKKPEGSGRGISGQAGDRYGKLVIKEVYREQYKNKMLTKALCVCDCGNEKALLLNNVKTGKTTSCGCTRKDPHNKGVYSVAVGQRFGRLVITKLYSDDNTSFAECQCDCGTIKRVAISNLKRGNTVSCGCANRDRMKNNNPLGKKLQAE